MKRFNHLKRAASSILAFMLLLGVMTACGSSASSTSPAAPAASGAQAPAAAPAAQPAGSGEKFVIKMGYGTSPGHPIDLASNEFKALVEERSGGRIEVNLFPSAQLGSERQLIEGLQTGTIEATPTTTGPMGLFDPAYYVFDLPYIFKNAEAADAVLDGPIGDEMAQRLEKLGLVCVAWWENGFRELTNNVRPVVTPADVNGLKLRTMENEVHMAFFNSLGATPTPMGFGEIYMALKSKTIDGQENPLSIIATNKFYEVQKYTTVYDYVYSPVVVLFSKDFWDKLPADLQGILRDAAYEVRIQQRKYGRDANEEYMKAITDGGSELTVLTDEQKAVWKAEADKIYPQFEAKIGKELLDKVKEAGWPN